MKKPKASTVRTLSALGVIAVVCAGIALHIGVGTPSSFGIYDIAALCPLGAVEAALAAKTVVPPMLLGAVLLVVVTVFVGRAFCGWGCPVPLLRRIFGTKEKPKSVEGSAASEGTSRLAIPAKDRGGAGDSRNWVLGGAVLSTAVLGFPVFCLICPVGLTFATIIALWRLFQFSETTLSLLIFPALLVVEVLVLRKWCHRFCPVGALLSLIARLNRTFQPTVSATTCLHERGSEGCSRCSDVCPEGINLHESAVSAPMHECTRCGRCQDACPTKSISFPFLATSPRKQKRGEAAEAEEELAAG